MCGKTSMNRFKRNNAMWKRLKHKHVTVVPLPYARCYNRMNRIAPQRRRRVEYSPEMFRLGNALLSFSFVALFIWLGYMLFSK